MKTPTINEKPRNFYFKDDVESLVPLNVPDTVQDFSIDHYRQNAAGRRLKERRGVLTSLAGGPKVVNIDCKLENLALEGFSDSPIKLVKHDFRLTHVPLKSLEGMPFVGNSIHVENCPNLVTLKGMQEQAAWVVVKAVNYSIDLSDGPKEISGHYVLDCLNDDNYHTFHVKSVVKLVLNLTTGLTNIDRLYRHVEYVKALHIGIGGDITNSLQVMLLEGVEKLEGDPFIASSFQVAKTIMRNMQGRHIFRAKLELILAGYKATAKL